MEDPACGTASRYAFLCQTGLKQQNLAHTVMQWSNRQKYVEDVDVEVQLKIYVPQAFKLAYEIKLCISKNVKAKTPYLFDCVGT